MLGSQALETAIGLALLFFVVSTAASTIVEIWSRVLDQRANHLEEALGALLAGTSPPAGALTVADALAVFKGTSVYDAALAGAGTTLFRKTLKRPSYLSAKAFADGVVELLLDERGLPKQLDQLPDGIRRRLVLILRQVGGDLTAIKADLERQFDETMERVSAAYKRWATLLTAVVGLLLAAAVNVDTFTVAGNLWKDSATRQAVVDAASSVVANGKDAGEALTSVATTTDRLTELHLPVGWTGVHPAVWVMLAGWLATALLVMLGGPFWFDVLTKLVSLRSSGNKPPTAPQDPLSSTTAIRARRQPAVVVEGPADAPADAPADQPAAPPADQPAPPATPDAGVTATRRLTPQELLELALS